MLNFNNWYAPNPIVFFGNIPVHWYGILIGIGFVAGIAIAYFRAKSWGEDPEKNNGIRGVPVIKIKHNLFFYFYLTAFAKA